MKFSIIGINIKRENGKLNLDSIQSSIKAALDDSGIKINVKNRCDVGIFLGTTFSNSDIRKNNTANYHKGGVRVVNPADFPKCLISYLGGYLSTAFDLKGANSTLSSGASSGLDAFTQAAYFVKRSKKNKAVIIELNEKISEDLSCSLEGSVCLVIENNGGAGKSQHSYGDVLGIESFFEREGENKGLISALQMALKKYTSKISNVDYIFGLSMPKTEEYDLAVDALKSFTDPERFISLPSNLQKRDTSSGLSLIANVLKNDDFGSCHSKKFITMLFILLGENANSSCMAIKIHRKRRVNL